MENQPIPPRPAETPKASSEKEDGFFSRWRKKSAPAEAVADSTPEAPRRKAAKAGGESSPEAPEVATPKRRNFGKNVLNFLFGNEDKSARPEALTEPATPEAAPAPPTPEAPDHTAEYQRAGRMRRFARVVLANVLGVANAEQRDAKNAQPQPEEVDPLMTAADNLRAAADDLDSTIHAAERVSDHASSGSSETASADAFETEEPSTVTAENTGGWSSPDYMPPAETLPPVAAIRERLDNRLRRIEVTAEASRTAAVAATGLGVLAVIISGAGYFAGRATKREVKKQGAQQEAAFKKQQAEFKQLRHEQSQDMNRTQRRDYYERLSTFTSEQAVQTREAAQELKGVTEQYVEQVALTTITASVVERAPLPERRMQTREEERREWRPRQPETVRATPESTPEPLVRVESTERTEQGPSANNTMGSAGTGFFGGGAIGDAGQLPQSQAQQRPAIDPDSREARQLEELRKMQEAKLRGNAWLYSAALALAMVGLVIVTIFVG